MRLGAGATLYHFQQFRGFGCGDCPALSRGRCHAARLGHDERLCPVHHGCPDRTHPSGRAFCGRLRHYRSRRTGPVPYGRADLSVGLYPGTGPVACRSSAGRSTPAAGGALHLADDRLSFKVDPTAARRLFFQDCPEQTAAWAVSKLGPAPVRPQSVPLFISRKSQDLPRHAILTTEDRTIPPDWQARMASRLPEACITTLPVRPFPLLCRTARSGPASHRIGTGHGLRGGNGPAAGRWQTVACRLAARQSPGRASRLLRA